MVFTIEPILVEGDRTITVWEDNWTAVTVDGGRYVFIGNSIFCLNVFDL